MKTNVPHEDAIHLLQLDPKNFTVNRTLINFQSMVIKKQIPDNCSLGTFMEARNVIIRNWIENELEKNGHWELKVPYEEVCEKCKGTGEIYKLEKVNLPQTKKDVCSKCNGEGYLWLTCKRCHGSGRFKQESPGLIINVICHCSKFASKYGNQFIGKVRIRCDECRGSGQTSSLDNKNEKRDFKFTGKIYSTTKCPVCHGFGFPKPKIICNPVLSTDVLGKLIISEPPNNKDPLVTVPEGGIRLAPTRSSSMINSSLIRIARESI